MRLKFHFPLHSMEDTNVTFYAKAFDENGTALDTSGVQWKLVYDFNSSEGNNSNMAQYFESSIFHSRR